MTFKHTKFEDSETMRSLTKLAHNKGWVKDEPVIKTAAPALDLKPSDNLTENLLKLCSGLRASGFEKQAEELESKFVMYKRAQANSLYGVGGEEGEDLVHAAHPKGSHKLENVDSTEATFEDILDQHMKGVEVANKTPHGKLASSTDILKAVKVALGVPFLALAQDGSDKLYEGAKDAIEKFRSVYDTIKTGMGDESGENDQYFNMLKNILDRKDAHKQQGPTIFHGDFASSLTDSMNSLKSGIEPSYFNLPWEHSSFSPEQQQKWEVVQKYFPLLKKYADRFHTAVSQIQSLESKTQTERDAEEARRADPEAPQGTPTPAAVSASEQVVQKYRDTINSIGRMRARIQAKGLANSATLIGWLDNQALPFATKNLDDFSKSPYKDDQQVITSYLDKINNVLQPRLQAFQQKWSV